MRRALGVALVCALGLPAAAEVPKAPGEGVYRCKVLTSDGVALATYRYAPPGGGLTRPPVLLLADLGLGRAAFDLDGRGLARRLQQAGRDVYVVELRGHGSSDVPLDWRLADLVRRDLPAVVAAIGQRRPGLVDLVAHGYVGTLAMAATVRELEGRVGRVVALSTPALLEVPNPRLEALLERGGAFARLAQLPEGRKELGLLLAHHGVFRRGVRDALLSGLSDLGAAASGDLLAWMRSGDLELGPGDGVAARLSRYDRPTLLFLPVANNFAPSELASPFRELAPSAPFRVRLLSRFEQHGEDYSHLSLLQGAAAERDVWAPLLAFLEAPERAAR